MALDPQFANVPKMFLGQLTTAITSRTAPGAGAVKLIDTGRTYDLAIKRVSLAALAATAAKGQVMFWIGDGTNPLRRLGREYEVSVVATVDADDPAWSFDVVNEVNDREPWLILPKDRALWAGCTTGDDIDVVVQGAEYQ